MFKKGRIIENLIYLPNHYLCQSKVEGYQFLTCLAGQTDHVPVALTLKCGLWKIQNSKILFQQSQKSLFSTQGLIKKNLCTLLGLTLLSVWPHFYCGTNGSRPCDPYFQSLKSLKNSKQPKKFLLTLNIDYIVHRLPSHTKLLSKIKIVVENMEYFENR